jgi:glycolate oxidase
VLIQAALVPEPSVQAVDRACVALDQSLGGSKVDRREASLLTYARDESEAIGLTPHVVVHAETHDDVAAVLRIAQEHQVPVTPRAGGTGRTGGAVPAAGGIVLATGSMRRILEIDRKDMLVVVQPGVVTAELHEACEAEGLFYPPDPNSLKNCMLGGNIAENAGGPRAFKYGVTRNYVLGLSACTMGGTSLQTGQRTVKGVTGYDVTSLLVGSEGTLAVVTSATLRLLRKPESVVTMLGLFDSEKSAAECVTELLAAGFVPRCVEFMDAPTLEAVRKQGVSIDLAARAVLLIEVDGRLRDTERDAEELGNAMTAAPGNLSVLVAQDAAQRDKLWEARRALSPATKKLAKYKLSEDIVVPRTQIPSLLSRVAQSGERHQVRHLTYGHAGDGNLHVNFLWDHDSDRPRVDAAILDLMRATVELGGTLSGEHGIGITKAPYLGLEQAGPLIDLQRNLKQTFDPRGLLNPGKIFFGARHTSC